MTQRPQIPISTHGMAHQQGATLIVVLLFLILISIAAVVAIRQARLDLGVATADQVSTALLQSADSAHKQIELIGTDGYGKDIYDQLFTSTNGPLGYFLEATRAKDKARQTHTYKFCQTPTTDYRFEHATIELPNGGKINGGAGECGGNQFTTTRNITQSQVSITGVDIGTAIDAPNLSHLTTGADVGRTLQKTRVHITVDSTIPAYSSGVLGKRGAPKIRVTQIGDVTEAQNCLTFTTGAVVSGCTR